MDIGVVAYGFRCVLSSKPKTKREVRKCNTKKIGFQLDYF